MAHIAYPDRLGIRIACCLHSMHIDGNSCHLGNNQNECNCTLINDGCITILIQLRANKYYLKKALKLLYADGSLARDTHFRIDESRGEKMGRKLHASNTKKNILKDMLCLILRMESL